MRFLFFLFGSVMIRCKLYLHLVRLPAFRFVLDPSSFVGCSGGKEYLPTQRLHCTQQQSEPELNDITGAARRERSQVQRKCKKETSTFLSWLQFFICEK